MQRVFNIVLVVAMDFVARNAIEAGLAGVHEVTLGKTMLKKDLENQFQCCTLPLPSPTFGSPLGSGRFIIV